MHALYTDFLKAFDRVNHELLLQKMEATGVHGKLLEWLGSYLCDRTQIVRVHNFKSFKIDVPLVVPQGSHLSPLLFNLFVNDISSCFSHSHFLMFADDLIFFFKKKKKIKKKKKLKKIKKNKKKKKKKKKKNKN